jgi:hypothetical protein
MARKPGNKNERVNGGNEGIAQPATAPAGDSAASDSIIEPTSITGSGGSDGNPNGNGDPGSSPRRRGRPAGSKSRTASAPIAVDKFGQLVGLAHFIASKITAVPEIELAENEAQELGGAVLDVLRVHGISGPSEDVAAYLALAAIAGKVYTPRFGAYKLRKMNEREVKRSTPIQNSEPAPSATIITPSIEPLASFSDPHNSGNLQ